MTRRAWVLAGATATGKSAVSQLLAERMGLSILSADSMLVYKGMDIGTATPSEEERGGVPYYGINLISPDQPFSTGAWLKAARSALEQSAGEADKPLIVTGGTGLYIKALTSGLDSEGADPERRQYWEGVLASEGIDKLRKTIQARQPDAPSELLASENPRRLIRAMEHLDASGSLPCNWNSEGKPVITALSIPRPELSSRIHRRVISMFEQGLLDEVRSLKESHPIWSETAKKAIGYKEALEVLDGELSKQDAIEKICSRTRKLAKRQETWFRHQQETTWCEVRDGDCVEEIADKVLCLWRAQGAVEVRI